MGVAVKGELDARVKYIDVGGYADESKWAAVQDAMIDAMVRLERAVSPYIRKLKV